MAIEAEPPITFCQKPSSRYMLMLEECGGDHRVVSGQYAINRAGYRTEKGWQPTYEARDSRATAVYAQEVVSSKKGGI